MPFQSTVFFLPTSRDSTSLALVLISDPYVVVSAALTSHPCIVGSLVIISHPCVVASLVLTSHPCVVVSPVLASHPCVVVSPEPCHRCSLIQLSQHGLTTRRQRPRPVSRSAKLAANQNTSNRRVTRSITTSTAAGHATLKPSCLGNFTRSLRAIRVRMITAALIWNRTTYVRCTHR